MEAYQSLIQTLALTMGVAWASGINLYATIFILGFMNMNGYATLPAELQIVSDPLVMTAAGFMYFVEFFADKIPGVDTGWDTLHTFVRIPAGAILAAGAIGDVNPAMELAAAMLGGTLAAGSHLTKSGTRVLINASPEPFSNWAASLSEDVLVIAGLWAALIHPTAFIVLMVIVIALMIWVLPKLWRAIKKLWAGVYRLFSGKTRLPEQLEFPAISSRHSKLEHS